MGIKIQLLIAALITTALAVSCSKSGGGGGGGSSSGGSSDMTISGTLSVSTTALSFDGGIAPMTKVGALAATSVTDLEIYAIAFTMPPVIGSASLDSSGNFSVSLPGAKGSTVTAIFRDKTDQSQIGTVVFTDSTKKDMNGNDSESSSVVLSDSVQLGAITLGTDGKVKIPVTQIQSVVSSDENVAVGTAFDPTGVWYMKTYDATVPSGYMTVGACQQGHDGPCVGFPLTLIRYTGKDFTPNGSCTSDTSCPSSAGTTGGDRYALSIWGGDAATGGFHSCGDKSGFTTAEARFHARIDIPTMPTVGGITVSGGHYIYNMPTGFCGTTGHTSCTSPYNLAWMWDGATAQHSFDNCRPYQITHNSATFDAWACRSQEYTGAWGQGSPSNPAVYVWNVGIQGGGCYNTTTGKPVNVTNWSSMPQGTCTPVDVTSTYGAGFYSNSCAYTNFNHDGDANTAAINVTCEHTGGQFQDSSGSPSGTPYTQDQTKYAGSPESIISNGADCSTAGDTDDAARLAGFRCYAEAYWQHASAGSSCQRDYRFDWSATQLSDFARDSDRGKPKDAFITNILKYTPDGQMATLEDEENQKMTINTGIGNSTFCEVSRRTVLSFRKISATRLLVDLKQSGQMNSTDSACVAAAKDALAGKQVQGAGNLQEQLSPQNMIFYVDNAP